MLRRRPIDYCHGRVCIKWRAVILGQISFFLIEAAPEWKR